MPMKTYNKKDIVITYKDILESSGVNPQDVVVVGEAALVLCGLLDEATSINIDANFNTLQKIAPHLKVDKFAYVEFGFGVWLRNRKHYRIYTQERSGVVIATKHRLMLEQIGLFVDPSVTEDDADIIHERIFDILEDIRLDNVKQAEAG